MKKNNTGRTLKNRQAGIGMRRLIALVLALAMLCAAAETSEEILLPDDSTQATEEELYLGDEATGDDEGGMDLELAEDAILDEDAPAIDALSLDGLRTTCSRKSCRSRTTQGKPPPRPRPATQAVPRISRSTGMANWWSMWVPAAMWSSRMG